MIRVNDDGSITPDTSAEGLDELADYLAADLEREGLRVDRDALRHKLEQFRGLVYDPKRRQVMRMVEHQTCGDWTRVTFEPVGPRMQ